MATTVTAQRTLSNQKVLTYPNGFKNDPTHCAGCAGTKGDCTATVASQQDVVTFTLADGRVGTVTVAPGASAAVITAAVQAWATANPIAVAPIVGAAIA